MRKFDYSKISQRLLENLSEKEKEVLLRRFGLINGKRETLQKIGDDFGITRERVRQIEKSGIEKLKKISDKELEKAYLCFKEYLVQEGGLKREDVLIRNLGKGDFDNHIYFLLSLGDSFYRFKEDEHFYPFWAIEKALYQKAKEIVEKVYKVFQKIKKPLTQEEILNLKISHHPSTFFSSLEISKHIEQGPLGHFGLVFWPEINPKGVRDKALLVLKKAQKPLHFREIAHQASLLFQTHNFSQKKEILPQTVHNELIKDERFVLVGRGIYALREWGYIPGTVKEIIFSILQKENTPLTKEEIINKVLQQRIVKVNTIVQNLNNKLYFEKDSQGRYKIRES